MKRLLPILLAAIAVTCSPLPMIVESESVLVIDGSIEDGHYPVVKLCASVPVDTETRSIDSLSSNILLWARVTIDDGEKETVLMGRKDESRYPPYVYTTYELQGESGKTYTVRATARKMSVNASVTMPKSVELEDIRAEKMGDTDRYIIKVKLPAEGFDYASFYVMRDGVDNNYLHAYLSSVDALLLGQDREISVMPGRSVLQEENEMYYVKGQTVYVKFVTMDRSAYDFWSAYDNDVTVSASPFFPKMANLPTNVNGGLGYWNAYGVREYKVVIPK